jgi:ankyrin repeat protein
MSRFFCLISFFLFNVIGISAAPYNGSTVGVPLRHKRILIESNQKFLNPIYVAIQKNDIYSVKYFVEKGFDINLKRKGKYTPLELAIKLKYLSIIKYLLDHGADPYSALQFARKNGTAQEIIDLLESKIN